MTLMNDPTSDFPFARHVLLGLSPHPLRLDGRRAGCGGRLT